MSQPTSTPGRRPILDRSAVLVRRAQVCAYERGERPVPDPDRVLRLVRPAILPLSSLAGVRTDQRMLSLTYDDGPDRAFTPGILDALAEHEARATFFVLVPAAEAAPDLIARMLAEGHEVALHGIDHSRLSELPLQQAIRAIGLDVVIWSAWARDWEGDPAEVVATGLILAGMRERGYSSQTVSGLLARAAAVRTLWAERR